MVPRRRGRPARAADRRAALAFWAHRAAHEDVHLPRRRPADRGILVDGSNSIRVRPDDRIEAAQGLRRLIEDSALAATLGRNAAADAEKYTWEGRAARLIAFLEARLRAIPAAR
jgi:hypothetical protein